MKQKYGIDVQFPIDRYVVGLTSAKVPNRSGEYPANASYYQGGLNNDPQDLDCDNPLFSTGLPTTSTGPDDPNLCNLAPNAVRTPASNLVYYAHIGGVPHELLTTTDSSGNVTALPQPLTASQWTLILGNDPENYDYGGIDSHMIESYLPRGGAIPEQGAANATIVGDEAPDWVTNGTSSTTGAPSHANLPVDREYACVFKLATPRSCDTTAVSNSEADIAACDCSSTGLAANQIPPVCSSTDPTQQVYAKAYPTVRELLLAKKLGSQGIVSSICPIDVDDNNDPLYGYRPAISSIIDALKVSLGTQCLPETLPVGDGGAVPCNLLVTMPSEMGQQESFCNDMTNNPELTSVDPGILADYKNDQHAAYAAGNSSVDLSLYTTCQIRQVFDFQGTCANNTDPSVAGTQGWCYVTAAGDAGGCAQSIQFSSSGQPPNGIVGLQCLENSSDFANGNGTGGSNDP
jgi:hypothetical protein